MEIILDRQEFENTYKLKKFGDIIGFSIKEKENRFNKYMGP